MAGIHVLLDSLQGGNKSEKATTPRGKDVIDSSGNAAEIFAAMLSGSMNLNANPKGQSSSIAGQDLEGMQCVDDSSQKPQNLSAQGNVLLGYGNYALPFITQPMLQSDLPAGKEANSGDVVGQGAGGLATADTSLTNAPIVSGNNLELAMLNLVSQAADDSAQSGMTTPIPEGDNPGIAELDKYRQVIADLLVALSGEITDTSLKGTPSSSENLGTKDLSQDMAKIVSTNQKGIQPLLDVLTTGQSIVNPELNAKIATLLAALKAPQRVNETLQAEGDMIEPMFKGHLEASMNKPKVMGNALEPAVTVAKDTAIHISPQLKSSEVDQGDPVQPSESSTVKDVQNQNSNLGIGVASNIVAPNVADGKTVIPVWEQISTVLREQVKNRSQDLKQLDIQLHPADLGKIQINLRWENGQVHLQVQASEAATGQVLQNQLPDLRQALTSQGVNCGMLQMGQGGERQKNPHGDSSQRAFEQNSDLDEDEDPISVTSYPSLGQDEINRINVKA
ncbi:flagellar hook-length control protein FliK [Desulfosporosinus sp. Sb-LF]|uniref:flagellar hook-length control protein FliK n=1 Tax=Desulfosporosinus sp. Sb-LF TaxID=2560027 RepID=UPI00107F9485|nr:flagellar hook-length control protein FliK [Desulfosporosinus sp. Sb-LF]TGE32635.1 flagellar hook-length control protein FliK [Desulfosporosinus sp. Sb-LF]